MAKYLDDAGLAHLWERIVNTFKSLEVKHGSITEDKIAYNAVTTRCIADGAVTPLKLADGSVAEKHLTPGCVGFDNLQSGSVSSDQLVDGCVDVSKLSNDLAELIMSASPLGAYPVGSIYLSMSATSPQALFGGTWAKLEGRFLMCSDSSHAVGTTGGSNDAVVVSHTHSGESDTDGSHTHSISGGGHSHSGSTSSAGSHTHGTSQSGYSFVTTNGTFNYGSGSSGAPAPSSKVTNTAGSGVHSHSVTVNTSSSHSHTMTSAGGHYHNLTIDSAGQSGTNKNMPKYITVNAWQRTA